MSVAGEYSRIQLARDRIRSHLVSLGKASGSEKLDVLAGLVEGLGVVPQVTTVDYTMTSSGWSNSRYSFESVYPSSQYDISIEPSSTCTAAELKAYSKAQPVGSTSDNVVIAYGTVPTTNIPIIITATRK